ncbi:PCNA-associated factor [Ixodes scapularis]
MVRTKGDSASKAVGAKAPSKAMRSPGASSSRAGSSSSSKNANDRYSGGNAYCPRPTPAWQKEITTFFTAKPKEPSGRGAAVSRWPPAIANRDLRSACRHVLRLNFPLLELTNHVRNIQRR